MKKILFLAVLLFSGAAFSMEAPKLIGDYGDWSAYTFKEGGANVCYIASTPKKDEGAYKKRGDIYAVVTHRPKDNSFDVVNFVAGYTFKSNAKFTVKIGRETFTSFFVEDDKAWTLTDEADKALVKAMVRGEHMIVEGTSSRGTKTKDTYSLKGFARAYKAINAKCGKK
ncbi:MAG: hypothetical protein J5895_03285 [Alphaproteobacteria bacterium]|nr:hypothetical protein [Alphaproteobacteria bacterium]MBQ7660245.1 hypothetical protein [Alphaproteobacteria bacterium]